MLVISGALYRVDEDTIVKPHFTTEYAAVDCTRYFTKEELEGRYGESFIRQNKNDFIEEDGIKYYYAEYSPFHVSEDWELLSDLSELNHLE